MIASNYSITQLTINPYSNHKLGPMSVHLSNQQFPYCWSIYPYSCGHLSVQKPPHSFPNGTPNTQHTIEATGQADASQRVVIVGAPSATKPSLAGGARCVPPTGPAGPSGRGGIRPAGALPVDVAGDVVGERRTGGGVLAPHALVRLQDAFGTAAASEHRRQHSTPSN